ncbi:MAG: IS256 family transposase [Calditrichaeota bacterium]|nr:IS256 family transposase [Calditrichota bacterium]
MARSKSGKLGVGSQGPLLDQVDFLKHLVGQVLQQVLETEFTSFLGAKPYQRSESRQGHRNGSYQRELTTRAGRITLRVPRDRAGQFSTELFAGYQRSEKAFLLSLIEMYQQGVSTRKVGRITEALCGVHVFKDQVSDLAITLDDSLAQWRNRPLSRYYPYLYVDGTYYKVRQEGRVVSMAALLVLGVNPDGGRELLATTVVHAENEADYLDLFRDLRARGIERVDLVIGDDHAGLKAALAREFPLAGKQRCWVHVLRNLAQKVPARHRAETRARLKAALEAPTRVEGERILQDVIHWVALRDEALADWLEDLAPELLAHMEFPRSHWRKLRSNNMLERVNEELRRRVRVLRIFPNRASCLRLVSALAMEFDEDWQTDRRYLNMALLGETEEAGWKNAG